MKAFSYCTIVCSHLWIQSQLHNYVGQVATCFSSKYAWKLYQTVMHSWKVMYVTQRVGLCVRFLQESCCYVAD